MDGAEKVKKMRRITQKLKSCENERIEEPRQTSIDTKRQRLRDRETDRLINATDTEIKTDPQIREGQR